MKELEIRLPVSVIIPIHRSDIDIRRCLNSLLNNPRLDLQIIVAINSDSKSELSRITKLIPTLPCVTICEIPKTGKANSINEALRFVRNKYVLIGDADTIFIEDGLNFCLEKIMQDETVIAITGIVEPVRKSLLTTIQGYEYRRIFLLFKPFWNLFHANVIVSGCAGLFRTDSIRRVGAYDCNTLGEDFEITLKLHEYYLRNGLEYKIQYVDTMIAMTEVPQTFSELVKQRGRWFTGQLEVVWKYRGILLHPFKYRRIFLPYLLIILFEIWETYLKWVLFGIGVLISVCSQEFFLKVFIVTCLGFLLFEILFNSCVGQRLKVTDIFLVVGFTCMLALIQFILKDSNIIMAIKLRMRKRKENSWE